MTHASARKVMRRLREFIVIMGAPKLHQMHATETKNKQEDLLTLGK